MHNSYDVIETENNVTLNTLQTRHIYLFIYLFIYTMFNEGGTISYK